MNESKQGPDHKEKQNEEDKTWPELVKMWRENNCPADYYDLIRFLCYEAFGSDAEHSSVLFDDLPTLELVKMLDTIVTAGTVACGTCNLCRWGENAKKEHQGMHIQCHYEPTPIYVANYHGCSRFKAEDDFGCHTKGK